MQLLSMGTESSGSIIAEGETPTRKPRARMGSVTREDRIALKAEAERSATQARNSLGRSSGKAS